MEQTLRAESQTARTAPRLLANIILYALLASYTVLFILFAPLPLLVLAAVRIMPLDELFRRMIWVHGRGASLIMGLYLPITIHSAPGKLPAQPRILVSNHLSSLDLYLIGLLPYPNVLCAVGSWPFRTPVFGLAMRIAGYLDTPNLPGETFLEEAARMLGRGACVLIYPEGKRSRSGSPGRFHSGAFSLSVQTGIPITPICLRGTGEALPPGRYVFKRAPVSIHILPDVAPSAFANEPLPHIAMRRAVQKKMLQAL